MGPQSTPHMKHFHYRDFIDAEALVSRKQGRRCCLAIPTLNEADTIGDIVSTARHHLIDTHPLLDEILVVDSGSSDATCKIAEAAGARAIMADTIAPHLGNHRGKGENLWKSLVESNADLICWIDGDLVDFHAGYVKGVLGPLLVDPEVDYVKTHYERPLHGIELPGNGGRVSEILIRPMLSLFYPELCAVIQPLSGEYGARRELLEQLAFPTGYGVEIAHLIDLLALGRLDGLAQTDLVRRAHRNRSDEALGAMAFAILQVIFRRLERDGRLQLHRELATRFLGWDFSDGPPTAVAQEIPEPERPPLSSLGTSIHANESGLIV